MEEVKRGIGSIALTASIFCYLVPLSQANVCVDPKIKRAQSCGIVLDIYGERIPNAVVTFRLNGDSISESTDSNGSFSEPKVHGKGFVIEVSANGFRRASQKIERIVAPGQTCIAPLYVMLQIGGDGCSMIRKKKSDLPIAKRE